MLYPVYGRSYPFRNAGAAQINFHPESLKCLPCGRAGVAAVGAHELVSRRLVELALKFVLSEYMVVLPILPQTTTSGRVCTKRERSGHVKRELCPGLVVYARCVCVLACFFLRRCCSPRLVFRRCRLGAMVQRRRNNFLVVLWL